MIRKIAAPLLFLAVTQLAYSQESTTKKTVARPDIPGTFVMELGVNSALSAPSRFDLGFWGSRTLNVYYQYDIRVLKSRFSVVPGIGLSLERYKFTNGYQLAYTATSPATLYMASPVQAEYLGIRKSQLITNYLEIPVEICYRSNPEDPARSFKASIGGRVGFLYDSFTKIKYKEDGEIKQLKNKQRFELNQFRYGLSGKVGIGNFSVFGYYNLSPLFEKNKGPLENDIVTEFNTMTIGISLSSF